MKNCSENGMSTIEKCLTNENIFCVAFGYVDDIFKYYFFGKSNDQEEDYFLMEMLANPHTAKVYIMLKSKSSDKLLQFKNIIIHVLTDYNLVIFS